MFEAFSKVLMKLLAILATAVVVKTIDDVLDLEDPNESPYVTFFGRGTLPYMTALFSLALLFHFETAFTLFWASYTMGMIGAPSQVLPTGVMSIIEIGIGVFLLFIVSGRFTAIWGIMLILAIQLGDDLLDKEDDRKGTNVALLIGSGECLFLLMIALYIAVTLRPLESTAAFITALWLGNGFSAERKEALTP